jgi:predicted metal-dependent HD superfamily phosphohydrolase
MNLEEKYARTLMAAGLPYEGYCQAVLQMYEHLFRTYHNLDHIERMLEVILKYSHFLSKGDYIAVKIAIFYHDCVYVPGFDKNEELSANIAVDHLTHMGAGGKLLTMVPSLIMATKNHEPPPGDVAAAMICDADLYELSTERYNTNSYNIWCEFGCPDKDQWDEGRKAFLIKYLSHEKLFHLPNMEDAERAARSSMKKELLGLGGCPNDTNGDSNCGKIYCPYCGH